MLHNSIKKAKSWSIIAKQSVIGCAIGGMYEFLVTSLIMTSSKDPQCSVSKRTAFLQQLQTDKLINHLSLHQSALQFQTAKMAVKLGEFKMTAYLAIWCLKTDWHTYKYFLGPRKCKVKANLDLLKCSS